jgi:hypothetical protein
MSEVIARADLVKKWKPVLEHEGMPKITDRHRMEVTAQLLENQSKEMSKSRGLLAENSPANSDGSFPDAGGVAKFDPVLISLVRRAMPQLIAYDICGVQPMTQPTGLVFAMKSRYTAQNGTEALYNEADSGFSGTGVSQVGSNPVVSGYTVSTGNTTSIGEALGSTGGDTLNQMAFSIEKTTVTAVTRALQADYSIELAQDMKAIHGLDAEAELSNILSSEIIAETNREVVRSMYITARPGAQNQTVTPGVFDLDVDSNGRWSVEKFKGLMFQIERDANVIAQQTRLGKGNFILCSSDVASALAMSGVLDYAPALDTKLDVDEASTTFAGVLNGKMKVYVDPYSANIGVNPQFVMVGYKGNNPMAAGFYFCPYVPLQMVRAVDPNSFQPKIAFKSRYGMIANPFALLDGGSANGIGNPGTNYFYRIFSVENIM